MKRGGPPNAFEQRFTKLICDRAEVADSKKVEEMKEKLEKAQKEIVAYQKEMDKMRNVVQSYIDQIGQIDNIDTPCAPLGIFCKFCQHDLPDLMTAWCHGTKCLHVGRNLPCLEWCLERKGLKHYTCSTDKCTLRVCGTFCTKCTACKIIKYNS